jgi:hypothetical protein
VDKNHDYDPDQRKVDTMQRNEPMRYFGGEFPKSLFAKIEAIAIREKRPKIWVVSRLCEEALAEREEQERLDTPIDYNTKPSRPGCSTEPGTVNFVDLDGRPRHLINDPQE